MTEFPKTIEVGNGPDIEVHSQAEADAFHAAARANAAIYEAQEKATADLLAAMGGDGEKWAEEFARIAAQIPDPLDPAPGGFLHSWFANAIEAGKSATAGQLAAADAAYQELDREFQAASDFLPSDWRAQAIRAGADIPAEADLDA